MCLLAQENPYPDICTLTTAGEKCIMKLKNTQAPLAMVATSALTGDLNCLSESD